VFQKPIDTLLCDLIQIPSWAFMKAVISWCNGDKVDLLWWQHTIKNIISNDLNNTKFTHVGKEIRNLKTSR
jgi:hypothetical protein